MSELFGGRVRHRRVACGGGWAFFASGDVERCGLWSCRDVWRGAGLGVFFDGVYVGFGAGLCGRIMVIPMGAGCAPLVADLFLICYRGDFVVFLSGVKQAESIEAFESTSRYLDDLLDVDSPCFGGVVGRVCPPGLMLSKASASCRIPVFGFAFFCFRRTCFVWGL